MSKTLQEALIKVPSFGPNTAMKMLEIERKLREAAIKETDAQIKGQLLEYAEALKMVCSYAAVHQIAAIGEFERLLKLRKEKG